VVYFCGVGVDMFGSSRDISFGIELLDIGYGEI
jgi:hypothetical protein